VTGPAEPKPWLDDDTSPPEVRALLAGGRTDGPSAAELERLARRLAPVVGVAAAALAASVPAPAAAIAPAAPVAPSAAGGLAGGLAGKLGASLALKVVGAACLLGAGYVVLAPRPLPRPAADIAAPVLWPPASAPAAATPPAARREPVPSVLPLPSAEPAPRSNPRPIAPPSELSLIQRAQSAAEPARALAALRQHERLYPDGMFAQEREVLFIRSLLALDRRADAEARAAQLAARHPGSAHLRRVRVLLDEPRQK
jgi:hypothetical protein